MQINTKELIKLLIMDNNLIDEDKITHLLNDLLDIFSDHLANNCSKDTPMYATMKIIEDLNSIKKSLKDI